VAGEPSVFASVAFALASAASWGAGDFSGGLASRRASAQGVVIAAQGVGIALFTGLALAAGEALPAAAGLGWAALAGGAGAVGLVALYRALAGGRMGIAAPVCAVVGAIVPVLAGAVLEGPPRAVQGLGFGLALAAVWLLAAPGGGEARAGLPALALPALAGLGFGLFFVLIDRVDGPAVFWPLGVARTAALLLLLATAGALGRPRWPAGPDLPLTGLAGVLDAAGNAFFVLAARAGRLDVAAVLASLYPASTVALAWLILGERLGRLQVAGVLAALAAVACVAR
jgi:drug/metabolite transporter (DMT)-like permease